MYHAANSSNLKGAFNSLFGALCIVALSVGCSNNSQPSQSPAAQPEQSKTETASPAADKSAEKSDEAKSQAQKPKDEGSAPTPDQGNQQTATNGETTPPPAATPEMPSQQEQNTKQSDVALPPSASEPAQPKADEAKPAVEVQKAPENESSAQHEEVAPSNEEHHPEGLEGRIQKLSEQLGFKIEVSSDLSPVEAEQGLQLLNESVKAVKSATPMRLEPLFDYVVLARQNESPKEDGEKVVAQFNFKQGKTPAYYAAKFAFARCSGEAVGEAGSAERLQGCMDHPQTNAIKAFRAARVTLETVRKEILDLKIECKAAITKCAIGAQNLKVALPFVTSETVNAIKLVTIENRNLLTFFQPIIYSEIGAKTASVEIVYSTEPSYIISVLNKLVIGSAQ